MSQLTFSAAADATTLVGRSIRSAAAQGRELIEAAQKEATFILRQAETEREAINERAYAEGHERGLKDALSRLISEQAKEERLLRSSAARLASVCAEVCREVLGESLKLQPEAIAARVRRGLETIPLASWLILQVRPEDIDYAARAFASTYDAVSHRGGRGLTRIQEDPSLEPGAFRVLSEYGVMEGNITRHLDALITELSSTCKELLGPER